MLNPSLRAYEALEHCIIVHVKVTGSEGKLWSMTEWPCMDDQRSPGFTANGIKGLQSRGRGWSVSYWISVRQNNQEEKKKNSRRFFFLNFLATHNGRMIDIHINFNTKAPILRLTLMELIFLQHNWAEAGWTRVKVCEKLDSIVLRKFLARFPSV